MRWFTSTLGVVVCVAVISQAATGAQQPASSEQQVPNRVMIAAHTAADVTTSNALISQLTQAGDLIVADVRDDDAVAGRRFETLRQVYRGVPVEGGGVTRQMSGATTISIFGTILTAIDLDPVPGLRAEDAARVAERESRRDLVAGTSPSLLVMGSVTGQYVLVYRATTQDAMTYYVDANTGQILRRVSERMDAVGSGTGVLGDVKKMSTTGIGGAYRTQDTLRPAGLTTLDTRGSEQSLNRILNGSPQDGDYPIDADNVWTDSRIVDAHVHTGWTYDYFFKRFQWSGSDGAGRAVYDIAHRGLINNAFFQPPPFGPAGGGATVYGDTSAGVPVTSLDVVAHELMHGVTDASLRRRTGSGLQSTLVLEGFGTTSFTFGGTVFPCVGTVLVYPDGTRPPFWCNNGRFVLASNHGGAINEGFSDIFGTSVEFFYHQPGNGPLKADYLMAEDIPVFGPNRSLISPSSIGFQTDTSAFLYPDHRTRTMAYAMVIIQGTQTNPIVIDLAAVGFVNGVPLTMFTRGSIDNGGVHLNCTVLGHAFYLAIEGGRNPTSGLNVTGVGAQNREQVERVFFRAMTQLMPSAPTLSTAAAAVIQSAVDLYGASSPVTQAVSQAMTAVGLIGA